MNRTLLSLARNVDSCDVRDNPDREAGQGLAEYALILALIAIVAIVALLFLGNQISSILNDAGRQL
jgi:Flp pilus assembly pilin Flp